MKECEIMIVLIPAYEPTEKMITLIMGLNVYNVDILIVNDGSDSAFDTFFDQAEELGCKVLKHPVNQGKGAALKTGFSYILSQRMRQHVVCADADAQHSVKDILNVGKQIQNKPEIILGVRRFEGKSPYGIVPLKSRIGNKLTAIAFKLATGFYISDTQTGLRGFCFDLLPWLCSIEGSRFEYELNMLLKTREASVTIREIPISTIYENDSSRSHFRPIVDSFRIYLPLVKFCASSLLSSGLDFFLLLILRGFGVSLFFSVALARITSSTVNYFSNKIFVFEGKKGKGVQSALRYFASVAGMMLLNYFLIAILTRIGLNLILAKLMVESLLFVVSYLLQKHFVFKH